MEWHLLVIKGPKMGHVTRITRGQELSIGRSTDCDLTIEDSYISRVHCRIKVGPKSATLHDDGSKFGTFVNEQQVAIHRLQPGDLISLGKTEIRFEEDSPPDADSGSSDAVPSPKQKSPSGKSGKPVTPPANAVSDGRLNKLIGQTLQRYEICEAIAKGATGMVFRANDTKHDRDVALKVLWPELSRDEEEVQRFIRAIKTMLPVKHPNIVRLHGAGASDGYCWMAMEFVEGESLSQVIQKMGIGGMLGWEHAFRAAVQIARALEVADENMVVHRNIRPSNILIRTEDRVHKLGDLMFAKALEGTMAETITRQGELIGELAYMSPEQTTGTKQIDCRSDIYGLGATIYQLVTGRLPFEGRNPAELIRKIRDEEPAKPTTFHLSIPPLFEGVILKMIAKQADLRYQNPTQLIMDLDRVAKYQGVTDV